MITNVRAFVSVFNLDGFFINNNNTVTGMENYPFGFSNTLS